MSNNTNSREIYKLPKKVTNFEGIFDNFESLVTSEMRAYKSKFSDPLSLNFKLMVDFEKPTGLFVDDLKYPENKNGALSYLKRIGDVERYEMLKRWISVFKTFITAFDFLILNIDGLSEISNAKPYEAFTDDSKITISIRETSDMLFQSLLTTFRHIWFDDIRCVEVIPDNLLKFDLNVLVYNAGYYNMDIYDDVDSNFFNNLKNQANSADPDAYMKTMFPTIKKMSDKYFVPNAPKYDFNYHLFSIISCKINNDESGKSFFDSISNEMNSDFVKNTLVLNFNFANYRGVFNNIFGQFDFVSLLLNKAIENKNSNILSNGIDATKEKTLAANNTEPYMTTAEKDKKKITDYFKNVKESFKQAGVSELNTLKKKPASIANSIIGPNSVIGNALTDLTDPNMLPEMIKNTVDRGISTVQDKFINGNVAKVNTFILNNNGNEDFIGVYDQYFKEKQNLIEQTKDLTIETLTPTMTIVKDANILNNNPDLNKTYAKLDSNGNPVDDKGNILDKNLISLRYEPNAAKILSPRLTTDDVIVDFATANNENKAKPLNTNISESNENIYINEKIEKNIELKEEIIFEPTVKNKNISLSKDNIYTRKGF